MTFISAKGWYSTAPTRFRLYDNSKDREYGYLDFQDGPVSWDGVNGTTNEEIIQLLLFRLDGLNRIQPCRENSIAITKLQEALMWLQHRTELRQQQQVEGTEQPHKSELERHNDV